MTALATLFKLLLAGMGISVLVALLLLPESDSEDPVATQDRIELAEASDSAVQANEDFLVMPDFVGLHRQEIHTSYPGLDQALPILEERFVSPGGGFQYRTWKGGVQYEDSIVIAQYPPPGTPIEQIRDSFLVTGVSDSNGLQDLMTGYSIDPEGRVLRTPVWSEENSMQAERFRNSEKFSKVFRLVDFGVLAASDKGCEIPDGYLLTVGDGLSAKWLTEPCPSRVSALSQRFVEITFGYQYEVDYFNFRGPQIYCLEKKAFGQTWRGCTENVIPFGEPVGKIWVRARKLVDASEDEANDIVARLVASYESFSRDDPFDDAVLFVMPTEWADRRHDLETPCALEEAITYSAYGPNDCTKFSPNRL